MRTASVPLVRLVLGVGLLPLALGLGCTKEEPKVTKEEPKKATPVPDDMGSFNDFLPKSGTGGLAVKLDGGPEGGLAAAPGAGADGPGEADDRPGLKVTDPGSEPRAPRKYAFTANKVEKRVLTMVQEQSRGPQGGPGSMTFVIAMDIVPKKIQPTGTNFEAKVTKVELPGASAGAQQAQLAQALAGMNGLTGAFVVSPRGEAGEVTFAADPRMQNPLAEGVVQGMQQAIELILPPFPDQPIGAGAKWERAIEKKEGGVEQKAKHTYVLKELTNEGGVVEADIEIKVPKRAVQAQGLPPGATVSVDGKGKYNYQFRFDRVSTKVSGELSINQHVEVPDQSGKKQAIDQAQKVKHTLDMPGGGGGGGGAGGGAKDAPKDAPKEAPKEAPKGSK